MPVKNLEIVTQRVLAAEFLRDLYRRAVAARQVENATRALQARRDMLRNLREKRGYEA